MSWFMRFAKSTIGLKVAMAISGLVLFGFVIGHMVGNLQVYLGAHALNKYGAMLQSTGELLWAVRAVLLAMLVLHIASAVSLVMKAKAARPQGYRKWQPKASTYASRTMRVSGPIIMLFIIFHLLHLTVGTVHPDLQHCVTQASGSLQCFVYENVDAAFSLNTAGTFAAVQGGIVAFYLVAMLLLGMHLGHGAYSMFRTLGLNNPRYDKLARSFATGVAVIIVVGNCSIPLAVLTGLVGQAGGH